MDYINKHGWSRKWLRTLAISSFGSVIVLTPVCVIGGMKYGLCGVLPGIILLCLYSIPMNRYISEKNREAVERSKRSNEK